MESTVEEHVETDDTEFRFVDDVPFNPFMDFWHRFMRNPVAKIGFWSIILLLGVAIGADLLSPYHPVHDYSYTFYRGRGRYQPPSIYHPMGTDRYGKDTLSMIIHGSRVSLTIGIISVGFSLLVGIPSGALAGYMGGRVDDVISRLTDLSLCLPDFFLLLMIVAFFGQTLFNIMIIIGILGWEGISRLIRAEFLALRELEFVEAARALGAKDRTIVFKHILPNAASPVIVAATLRISGAILTEAALSFLGLGDPSIITWGGMLTTAQTNLVSTPPRLWLPIFPGLIIFAVVLAFNMIGDGMRDAIDPKLKNR